MITRLRGLHKNESGQSIVFSAITFLFLALFVFMVLNVGDVTSRKMRLTNNADAVAVSGATWMCRGYNLTAMINVSMSQVLAIIILMKSFKRADTIGKDLCIAQEAIGEALMGIPITAAAGAVLYNLAAAQYYVIEYLCEDVYEQVADELEGNGSGVLWDILDYMQDAEEIEVKAIPWIAQAEAVKTGMANGATVGFLYPLVPGVDLKLPFIDDEDRKFESLCAPTASDFNWRSIAQNTKVKKTGNIGMDGQKNIEHMPTTDYIGTSGTFGDILSTLAGSPGGFGPAPLEYFKAYLIYPLMRFIPPFVGAVYDGVVRATYTSMCTGEPGEFSYEKTSNNCEECKQHKDDLTELSYSVNVAMTIRKSPSKLDDIVEEHDCNCGDPSPCTSLGTVYKDDGSEVEVCKYYSGKVEGKDVWLKDEGAQNTLSGNDAKTFLRFIMHNQCKRTRVQNVYVYPDDYGFTVDNERTDSEGRVKARKFKETKIESCKYKTTEKIDPQEAWGSRGSDSDKPKPYLLNREDEDGEEYWKKHSDYVGIAYNLPKENIINIKAGLKNPNPVGMIYFSQAEIYVPEGVEPHIFNQCWQVRLVRFTKFKELSDKLNSSGVGQALSVGGGNSGSTGKFMKLFNALKEMFNGDIIIH